MPRERPHAPRAVKERATRSHVPAARAARHLISQVLADPIPDGRRAVSGATQDARMALALLSLTLTYGKTSDRFRLVDVSEATGYPTRTCGRILARLHRRDWLVYKSASVRDHRALCQVIMAAPSDEGRPDDVSTAPLLTVTHTARQMISDVLASSPSVALCRVSLALVADFITWLRLEGAVDRAALAAATQLDPRTVGRKLRRLAGIGVLDYTAGCGRGNLGSVSFSAVEPPVAKGAATTAGSDGQVLSLSAEERAKLNRVLHEVEFLLREQNVWQGQQFIDALGQLNSRNRFARQVTNLLNNGHEVALVGVLTARKFDTAAAYAGTRNLPGAIYARIEKLHTEKAGSFGHAGRVDTTALVDEAMARAGGSSSGSDAHPASRDPNRAWP